MVAVFEGEALTASEFCGGSEICDGGFGVPPSLVAASVVSRDLIGAKVIWEVYM